MRAYRCSRLTNGGTDLLILTTVAARGTEVLAGDGEVIDIQLSPTEATKTVWRLTHFSAERLTPEVTATGARIQIVSPDAAEIMVLSSDPSVGGTLSQSATRFARQAGLDRWQLASDLVRRTEQNWDDRRRHPRLGSSRTDQPGRRCPADTGRCRTALSRR